MKTDFFFLILKLITLKPCHFIPENKSAGESIIQNIRNKVSIFLSLTIMSFLDLFSKSTVSSTRVPVTLLTSMTSCSRHLMMNLYSRTLAHKATFASRGYNTPKLKSACFVCYLKILNTSWKKKNNTNCPRNSNNHGVENLVGHASGMNQNSKIIVLINNSKTAWPTFFFRAHL